MLKVNIAKILVILWSKLEISGERLLSECVCFNSYRNVEDLMYVVFYVSLGFRSHSK